MTYAGQLDVHRIAFAPQVQPPEAPRSLVGGLQCLNSVPTRQSARRKQQGMLAEALGDSQCAVHIIPVRKADTLIISNQGDQIDAPLNST